MTVINIPQKINDSSLSSQHSAENSLEIELKSGSSIIIIGANGTGKTKLAAYIEEFLEERAHRISAHRALNLNPSVVKIPESKAKKILKYGQEWANNSNERKVARWENQSTIKLLDDFDILLQYLFAEQNNIALQEHKGKIDKTQTKFDILKKACEELLPHRKLHISADDIEVSGDNIPNYSASQMSDGERAIFYILGQVLAADNDTVLIFDEPELHIHKSIISSLWDKIETLRPDCSFLIITHDIEFAATRIAKKYVIKNYFPDPAWDISEIPESDFDEQTIALILGSRKPILFVEGNQSSLDIATYRCCYPEWTIIPKGSCKDVIQAVSSLKRLAEDMPLLNLTCAGIVDQDSREDDEVTYLSTLNIQVLPVSEIENIFSLTDIAKEILILESYSESELGDILSTFKKELIKFIKDELSENKLDMFITRTIQRRIDNNLKKIDLSNIKNSEDIRTELLSKINKLTEENIKSWIEETQTKINDFLANENLDELLVIYDNKGILAKTGSILRKAKKNDFENWLIRNLQNNQDSNFVKKVKSKLPNLHKI
ncbi:TPA: AAA family ATPase [Pasteurella multocida]|nr:AAA family ATPase [Pasteurella multocida]HDR0628651.1 AAA family ATPase [Pasteurella multocida]HDR1108106.1 AAA family ATPase [Pasteurella multocida]HDR1115446.1 AAA family ATPase [Pasteurella multocida]HDR1213860.1 AAA family ATPase [Pasteurella multocida]